MVLLLLLHIRAVHLDILEFPIGGPLLIQGYFWQFKTMWRKQNLATALGITKEKLGVTMHFSKIIKLQFGNKMRYIALYFTVFKNNCCSIISRKCKVTPNFPFWIPIALAKICFAHIVINRAKILLY